jgi:hypothetical protein
LNIRSRSHMTASLQMASSFGDCRGCSIGVLTQLSVQSVSCPATGVGSMPTFAHASGVSLFRHGQKSGGFWRESVYKHIWKIG